MIPVFAATSLLLSTSSIEEEMMLQPSYSLEMVAKKEKSINDLLSQIQRLTPEEKDRLLVYSDYAAKKSIIWLEKSKKSFSKMKDRTGRGLCTDAVMAVIASFAAVDIRAKAVAVLLTFVARYAEDGCESFWTGIDELGIARHYAASSDLCLNRVRYG